MELCWLTLHVRDLKTSLTFYHDLLGLPINSLEENEVIKMAMLGKKEQVKIELLEDPAHVAATNGISLGIQVSSLSQSMTYLKKKNIEILRGPITPNPNISFFFISDPDGYQVQLVESKG